MKEAMENDSNLYKKLYYGTISINDINILDRKNYFKKQLESNPQNEQYKNDYRCIGEKLDELEEKFVAPDFYYCETVPVANGFKDT